jgi:acid stress chaperone HdeB
MPRAFAAFVGMTTALMASSGLHAQVTLDVTKITCGQFVGYKITNPDFLAVWVSGYYHGMRGEMVVDTQQLKEDANKLESYCLKNPDLLMIKAAETVTGKTAD